MSVDDIIFLNSERLAALSGDFDPITGKNSPGKRFLRTHPISKRKIWVPVAMKDLRAPKKEFDKVRVLYDFPYWAAKYVKIKRKGGGEDIPFILNNPQRKFVEFLEEERTANRPIRLILLKARQWGGSTCSQLYMAWLQITQEVGLNSLIIAHQGIASDEIKDMYDRMIKEYPPDLLGEGTKGNKLEGVGKSRGIFRLAARNCKIKIGTAERPDSCRGGDYNLVHCSEVGIWRKTDGKSPEDILRSACSGILYAPMTMIVYESTANGTGNFFHREYDAAKRGVSQFRNLFISWFEIEQYSVPFADAAKRYEFAQWLLENRESQQPASERAQSGAYLWWLWERGATLEAINWFVAERSKYSDHGIMASEYPSDDVEAFVHSGARVFDKYKVESLRAECRPPLIRAQLAEWPLLSEGGWKVWTAPVRTPQVCRDRYVSVVDIGGRSAKADWSVITIFDRAANPEARPEVVAQWRGHTDFDLLTDMAAKASALYHNALLVIESNTLETHDADRNVEGDQSMFILNRLRRNYDNLYMRRASADAIREGILSRYGFHTNAGTKPMIIANLVQMIREGGYVERDQDCLDEYLTYEKRPNGSYGALPGTHDDLLMTRAIGLHIIRNELGDLELIDQWNPASRYSTLGRSSPLMEYDSRAGFLL